VARAAGEDQGNQAHAETEAAIEAAGIDLDPAPPGDRHGEDVTGDRQHPIGTPTG
jgi:hypothetical protein